MPFYLCFMFHDPDRHLNAEWRFLTVALEHTNKPSLTASLYVGKVSQVQIVGLSLLIGFLAALCSVSNFLFITVKCPVGQRRQLWMLDFVFIPTILWHRWPAPSALSSACLAHCGHMVQGRLIVCMYRSRIMWGRHFDWCHFRPHRSALAPKRGLNLGGGAWFETRIRATRRQIKQNWVLRGIGKSWVGFRLVHLPNSQTDPQNWGSQNPSSNYDQMVKTVADGATPWIDGHCEVIIVANAPKYSVDLH